VAQPAPAAQIVRPAPPEHAPPTGTITEVEPEVTNIRSAPPSPKAMPHVVPRTDEPDPSTDEPRAAAEPTPLVPPPLNEPRQRR
jgi:hypothetical protein